MASLPAAIEKALQAAEQLKSYGKANEANTRSHLIDPVLAALGWDLWDVTVVDREYAVYDGTILDYALLVEGKPRLFLEAKALGKTLTDPKFVSQTVNYANNEGVNWCVLTDGLRYRIFKATESGIPMEQKLLFEVNLLDAANGRLKEVADALQRIGHASIAEGRLAEWAERIFTDVKVREALKSLIVKGSEGLFAAIESELEVPRPTRSQIQKSLQAIIAGGSVAPKSRTTNELAPVAPVAGKGTGDREPTKPVGVYDLAHHTHGKAAHVVNLFESATSSARQRGGDVTERIGKVSVNYFVGKRPFCSVKMFQSKVIVYLKLDEPASVVAENPNVMRDLTGIGHNGNGDVEYSLTSEGQLSELSGLIERAYAAAQ